MVNEAGISFFPRGRRPKNGMGPNAGKVVPNAQPLEPTIF